MPTVQPPYVYINLAKVINETEPLDSSDNTEYSGIQIPKFTTTNDVLFLTENDDRLYHNDPPTILTSHISELPQYIYNLQQLIAKKTEIIFKNI
ncbi:unnamed protein product [Didymodactylos carnosus]|uniref:Uncharacterized protein n=1 Tax=Didymodactylos carnosus TaxID=1234261 RepID=A0A815B011_9BILA|nr:unnamed protein product [Didymodactylos carnosus]CAF4039082.1 unnamed protein product [Didymodactylos carnosus]